MCARACVYVCVCVCFYFEFDLFVRLLSTRNLPTSQRPWGRGIKRLYQKTNVEQES